MGVLLQAREGDPKRLAPVMYLSRRLRPPERNYSVVEREAPAIYWCIRKLEVYLYGRPFILKTDHKPLLHLQSAERLNPRLKRWALYLSLFRFRAEHVEGGENHTPDLLSHLTPAPGFRQEGSALALADTQEYLRSLFRIQGAQSSPSPAVR